MDDEITNPALLPTRDITPEELEECHNAIQRVLRKYCDLHEDYYNIISLWILGTYFHKQFNTYPYLFLHAMKASGKTRLLKLIAALSYHGEVMASMSEAVLFRTAAESTICIDEFEGIGGKDKNALRELLNSAYKNGTKVKRIFKMKSMAGSEKYKVEEFDVFCPIVMANIWGMENVLADRCIQLILERSSDKKRILLLEDFENETDVKLVKRTFSDTCVGHLLSGECILTHWNTYITHSDTSDIHTQVTQDTQEVDNKFFKKIKESRIEGRHLELFFPLFQISSLLKEKDIETERIIEIAKKICNEKRQDDNMESRDISFMLFLNEREPRHRIIEGKWDNEFINVKELVREFRIEDDEEWITPDWIGRALRRLNLLVEKRRTAMGRQVRIDWPKVIDKARMFIKQPEIEKVVSNTEKEEKHAVEPLNQAKQASASQSEEESVSMADIGVML